MRRYSVQITFEILYFLDDNRAWNELFEAATQKSELLKQADEKLSEAKSSVSKAIDIIESGKKDSSINRWEKICLTDIKLVQINSAILKQIF